MVAMLLLLGLLTVATATDVRRKKIYNWTTYPGMLGALGLNALGSIVAWADWAPLASLQTLGWIGLGRSAAGLALCGFVMLLCYTFFKVGGGDVKLLAMVGAFLGPERGLEAMLWTFVLGAAMAVIVLIWRVGPLPLAARTGRLVLHTLRLGRFGPLSDEERADLQPPLYLAPSALAAAVVVFVAPSGGLGM